MVAVALVALEGFGALLWLVLVAVMLWVIVRRGLVVTLRDQRDPPDDPPPPADPC